MHQKANPIAVVAIGIYIPAFLALVVFAQQYSETWFVKKFLSGYGLVAAALLLFLVSLIVVFQFERRSIKKSRD